MTDKEIALGLLAANEQHRLAKIIEVHNLGNYPQSLHLAINLFEITQRNIQLHRKAAESLLRCPVLTTFGETESIRYTILQLLINKQH
ncbi:hypothetical protein ACROAH_15300 [Shewanella oncorhynchi]|uniref:hypothetical protein n=1 Tax=Shewanella TaxID=22 RepID=UPI0039B103EB